MQINSVNNQRNPQFGMAFRTPKNSDAMCLAKYAKLNRYTNSRGFEQLKKEQEKLKYCDLLFDGRENMVTLLDKKNNEFVRMYPASFKKQNPFSIKNIFARIFNPKKLLPENIYQAGEDAKKLDTQLRRTK